ncbi:hypothetical protein RND81_14G134200 [Saponaria officinalis]|uniref:Uncharacterized protein n=1 Tax=Saponaria officinalis TaxID=3572 RepID=A0AAW1GTL1_SAPOF
MICKWLEFCHCKRFTSRDGNGAYRFGHGSGYVSLGRIRFGLCQVINYIGSGLFRVGSLTGRVSDCVEFGLGHSSGRLVSGYNNLRVESDSVRVAQGSGYLHSGRFGLHNEFRLIKKY